MGIRMPKTCWAVSKRQTINLWLIAASGRLNHLSVIFPPYTIKFKPFFHIAIQCRECHIYRMPYLQNAIFTECHIYRMPYLQNAIFTKCRIYRMPYLQNAVCTECHIYRMPYLHNAIFTECHIYTLQDRTVQVQSLYNPVCQSVSP